MKARAVFEHPLHSMRGYQTTIPQDHASNDSEYQQIYYGLIVAITVPSDDRGPHHRSINPPAKCRRVNPPCSRTGLVQMTQVTWYAQRSSRESADTLQDEGRRKPLAGVRLVYTPHPIQYSTRRGWLRIRPLWSSKQTLPGGYQPHSRNPYRPKAPAGARWVQS